MGKTSSYPSYTNGTVSINGKNIATAKKSGNNITSNYNMSDAEKQLYNYAQNSFLTSLPQINVFSQETQDNINSQVDAYKNRALQDLNNTYTPMINNLKSDIAARFGNLNNSVFLDKLNAIESNRALALSDLAQEIQAQRSELYNNELSNRYKYLAMLNAVQNQINDNVLNYINSAITASNSGNNYNQNAYNATARNSNNLLNQAFNSLGFISSFL